MARAKKISGQSPKGVFINPNLTSPRDYKDDGKFAYSTSLLIDGSVDVSYDDEEGKAHVGNFLQFIDQQMEVSREKNGVRNLADPPYVPAKDADGNVIDGSFLVRFKVPDKVILKGHTEENPKIWDRKPTLFDSRGEIITPEQAKGLKIGSGTEGRLNFSLYHWKSGPNAGLRLELLEAQITKYVEFTGASRGFGAADDDDGGWVPAEATGFQPDSSEAATGADSPDFGS